MKLTRAGSSLSLRTYLLLLVAATLPLGAITTTMVRSADARQPEWLVATAAIVLLALVLAVTVARRITDVMGAITSAALVCRSCR